MLLDYVFQTRLPFQSRVSAQNVQLATTVSGRPPVVAFAPIVDRGLFGGISTGEGSGRWWQAPHAMKRSRLAEKLARFTPAKRRSVGGTVIGGGAVG